MHFYKDTSCTNALTADAAHIMCNLYPCRSAWPSLRNIVHNNVCVVSVASWKNSTARVLASGCQCFSTMDQREGELRKELVALCKHYASCTKVRTSAVH